MAIKDMINASFPGASSTLNSTLGKVGSLKDSAQAQFSDVTADASAMKSAVEGQAASLVGDLSSMIPPLPELPNLNAQGAFAGLADIDINSISGASSVADLKTSFGETLSAQGIDVDSIVSQVKDGVDIGGLIPNLEVGADGIPFELPANISFSSVTGLKELLPKLPDFKSGLDFGNLTAIGEGALGHALGGAESVLGLKDGILGDISKAVSDAENYTLVGGGPDRTIEEIKADLEIQKAKDVIRKKQTAKYKKIFKEQGKDAYQKAIFDDMNTDRLKRGADVIVAVRDGGNPDTIAKQFKSEIDYKIKST
jgi:hypothetical protein|tara:strand:+ start:251 stop:1183 length:933 start_codon:yes stop_codon:yes gene_type:complete